MILLLLLLFGGLLYIQPQENPPADTTASPFTDKEHVFNKTCWQECYKYCTDISNKPFSSCLRDCVSACTKECKRLCNVYNLGNECLIKCWELEDDYSESEKHYYNRTQYPTSARYPESKHYDPLKDYDEDNNRKGRLRKTEYTDL